MAEILTSETPPVPPLFKFNSMYPFVPGETILGFSVNVTVNSFVESALTTLGAVQVKEGKISRGVLLIPVLAAVAYAVYVLTSIAFSALVGV